MANNRLSSLKEKVVSATGRTGLVLRKNSPEILLTIGIVSFIGTVVLACKETLAADEILENHVSSLKRIEEVKELSEKESDVTYPEETYKRDKTITYTKTIVNFAKLYAPSVALGAFSIGCILTSRNIMNGRYLGAVAAYNAVSEAFTSYRKRVIEEEGVNKDRHYRYGTTLETIESIEYDEKGKEKKKQETVENCDAANIDLETAVFFDQSNPNWDENPRFSLTFLKAQQNIANDLLRVRGHIFLNEVYTMLGFPHTPIGSVVGWVKGLGDNYVDFGLSNPDNENVRRFVNGSYNITLLDFNHDGIIWDKI